MEENVKKEAEESKQQSIDAAKEIANKKIELLKSQKIGKKK